MRFTVEEIARKIDGRVIGDGSVVLTGFAAAGTAKAGDLTFAENELFFTRAVQSTATAILVDLEFASTSKPVIQVDNASEVRASDVEVLSSLETVRLTHAAGARALVARVANDAGRLTFTPVLSTSLIMERGVETRIGALRWAPDFAVLVQGDDARPPLVSTPMTHVVRQIVRRASWFDHMLREASDPTAK